MKIIKHEVSTYINGNIFRKHLYNTKEQALKLTRRDDGDLKREYTGAVEIDLYCESCDKDLKPGDEYLKVDEYTRYCSDCYEEESFTYYTVGGEQVADENDGEFYDEWDTEAEVD